MADRSTEASQTDPGAGHVATDPAATSPDSTESDPQDPSALDGSPRPENGHDENRDNLRAQLCAYSGCRSPLPIKTGRGNRQKYCEGTKSWGSKGLSCKQAALAVENYRSLFGDDEQAVDKAIADLGQYVEHIDRSLEPIIGLRDAVTNVREHLDGPVTESYAAREAALAQAREAEERAIAAQQQRDEATNAASAAEQRAEQAIQEREAAVRDRDKAIKAQTQAEARLSDAQTAKMDAEVRTEQANAAANEAQQTITRIYSERDSLHTQIADLHTAIAEERRERQRLQEALDAAHQQIHSERAEYTASVSKFLAETSDLRTENRQFTEQVQALSEEKGRLAQRVGDLVQRAETTEALLQSVSDELDAALADPSENEQLAARVAHTRRQLPQHTAPQEHPDHEGSSGGS